MEKARLGWERVLAGCRHCPPNTHTYTARRNVPLLLLYPHPPRGRAQELREEVAFVQFLFLVFPATVQHLDAPRVRRWDVVV